MFRAMARSIILASTMAASTTDASAGSYDVASTVSVFADICLQSNNSVERISQMAQQKGLSEANLASNPAYQYLTVPGERYFTWKRDGAEEIIVSGLDAPIDAFGPSVICSVKVFDVSIESAAQRLRQMGFELNKLNSPSGTVYLNNEGLNGARAIIALQNFTAGNQIGVSLMIAQQK